MNEPSTSQNQELEEIDALRDRLLELEQSNRCYQQHVHHLQQQLTHEQTARLQAEEQLQLTLASAQMIAWDMDLTTNRVICSSSTNGSWGMQEYSNDGFFARIHPDDRQQVRHGIEQAIAKGVYYRQEYRVSGRDGATRWLQSQGQVHVDETGRPIRLIGMSVDVTEQKQSEFVLREREEQLKLANERLQFAARAVNCLIYDWRLDADRVERTDGLEQLLGYSPEEAEPTSQWWRDRIHPDDLRTILMQAPDALATEDRFAAEYRVLHKSNHYIYVLDHCLVVARDEQGNPMRLVGSTMDISERKRIEQEREDAESQLRESQRFIQQIADAMPGTLYVYNMLEQRNVYVNRQIGELLGYTPTEIQAYGDRLFAQLMHPDDFAVLGVHAERLNKAQDDEVVDHEYRMRHADGEWRWLWSRNTVSTRTPEGLAYQVVGTVHDITARKRAEAALAESNQTLQAIIQACPLAIMGLRSDGVIQLWNPAAEHIFGWSAQEVIGQFVPTLPDGKLDEFLNYLGMTMRGEGLVGVEAQRRTKGRGLLDVEIWTAAVNEELANLSCLAVIADISDRKQAELSLSQSEERYRYLAESIPQLVWTADPAGGLIDVNRRWSDFTGLTLTQARTQGWSAIVHPDDLATLAQEWNTAQQEGSYYQAEGRIRRADGTYRWHLHQAVPLKDDQNRVIKWFGTATDIEDQKQLEQQQIHLLQQEQAAREQAESANRIKDEFLAVLSHELRTPLNPILGWTRLLRTRRFDPQATDRALETIERNTKLQAQLIEDLLDVSRILQGKLGLTVGLVDLAATVKAALETIRLSAEAKGIQIHTQLPLKMRYVNGDANRLQQVVWNLLSNAVKFTPPGGEVRVNLEQIEDNSTERGERDGVVWGREGIEAPSRRPLPPYPYAQLTLTDTGKGISPEFLPHVFEYFRQADSSTTRQFGGLGLGLAIVRHLVELHGGTVSVESPGVGQGATFTVQLPLIGLPTVPQPQKSPLPRSKPLSGVRVLVVDDEADMRDLMTFVLEEQGAAVFVAASAAEALQHAAEKMPDILISDVGMPEMDGYSLMQHIRENFAEAGRTLPAIALTAFAGGINEQKALAAGFQMHIAKPVDPEELIQAIARVIHSSHLKSQSSNA